MEVPMAGDPQSLSFAPYNWAADIPPPPLPRQEAQGCSLVKQTAVNLELPGKVRDGVSFGAAV